VRSDGVINIGVFNPSGVRQLLDRPDCDVTVYWVCTCDKNRMLRQLNREQCPDVREIVRRFDADYEDFKDIDFDYIEIPNETMRDFEVGVEAIVSQVETILAQGQN
jgi:2-polyprenyl-6-methoxyphenol hydroxylase-like FAD-dependent oxidoreductase